MIKICRLSISYKEESKSMKEVLAEAMQKAGVTMEQIAINGPDYRNKTHYGNWVLTPVLDNEATAKLAAVLGTKTDIPRQILEDSDLQAYHEGQKVNVRYQSDFGFNCEGNGKVIRKSNKEITILKKGSRSKGWTFKSWDEVTIEAY